MRVLVSPASSHGATAEIGRRIADVLRRHGLDVDVSQPEHITDLHRYDAFVIGSAVYVGQWKREAIELLERHAEIISSKPCWLFSSGPIDDEMPAEPLRRGAVAALLELTDAREHRLFGGRLDIDRLGRKERWLARWVKARDGDARPWREIEDWTIRIAAALLAAPSDLRAIDLRPPETTAETTAQPTPQTNDVNPERRRTP